MSKYFIAIIPPEPIASEIFKLKEYVRDTYDSKGALNSPTHITLHMPFEYDKEEKLISTFEKIEWKEIEIDLKDFGCFEPRVIFVGVKKTEELFHRQINVAAICRQQFNVFNSLHSDHPFHPHITIGFRDLKKPQFYEAWKEFENRKYTATFKTNKVSLLKHDGKIWREIS